MYFLAEKAHLFRVAFVLCLFYVVMNSSYMVVVQWFPSVFNLNTLLLGVLNVFKAAI